jgi:hypothetical protein
MAPSAVHPLPMESNQLISQTAWIEITDPQTRQNIYANPETGECTLELQPGMSLYVEISFSP